VGRWFSSDVVMLRQAVYRYSDADERNFHPMRRNRNHAAGHHHAENPHFAERGKNAIQFAMADHRFAAHQRNMHRPVTTSQIEDTFNQRVSAKISEFTECQSAAQMSLSIGVATGATEWTFPRNLNGQQGNAAAQNPRPRA